MSEFKTFFLCADDFGLNANVSEGILQLTEKGRLSAVSCMVNGPWFAEKSKALAGLKDKIQIGLHFNLTEGHFVSEPEKACFGFVELLLKSHLRGIQSTFIANEFKAQLSQFIRIFGFLPDFIDGHQHVHQFPVIRKALLDSYRNDLKGHQTYFRVTYPTANGSGDWLKTKILALTGGKAFFKQLNQLDRPHNPNFSGIYPFNPQTDYRNLFRQWLNLATPNTLVMCHPSLGHCKDDVIAAARVKEFDYLSSNEFLEDCYEMRCQLGR